MTAADATQTISGDKYDAWLFDLDGVITDTASVHGAAWKQMFDEYLKVVAERDNVPFKEFEVATDYIDHVDGKPRYEGVDTFLRSRGIELEFGDPDDPADRVTVCGLGNRKNVLFNEIIATRGADVFQTSVDLIRKLIADGKRVAVVTSSKNCDTVLASVGLQDLFEAKMDGNVAAERKIAGKPKPDTYLEAGKLLGSPPERTVVIEDAISGVQAGRAGNFGLVLGIARHDEPATLLENGADVVVRDLGELQIN